MILGVIISPPANHSLLFWYSVPMLKICIVRQDFSESYLFVLANILESVPMTENLNCLVDAIAFLDFQHPILNSPSLGSPFCECLIKFPWSPCYLFLLMSAACLDYRLLLLHSLWTWHLAPAGTSTRT